MKKYFYYILLAVLVILIALTVKVMKKPAQIASFEDCLKAGNPVMESYPRQCKTTDGQTFVESLKPEETAKPTEINSSNNNLNQETTATDFCGQSTKASCEIDLDCVIGGCSGQVCMAQGEDIITTCEMRACYDARKYGVICQCNNHQCQWAKENNND